MIPRTKKATLAFLTVGLQLLVIASMFWLPLVSRADEQSLKKRLQKLENEKLLDSILGTMDQKYQKINTLEITFKQTKHLMLMAEPVHSEGVLVFKRPEMLFWRFNNPDPTVMVLKGSQFIIHYPDLEQADIFEIGKYKERVAKYLGLSESMTKLKRYYDIQVIEEGQLTYFLELIPKRRRIKQKISLLEVWLSKETYLPVKIHYVEPNEDSTLVKITETKTNEAVDDSVFEYTLPEGTKLNYPAKKQKPQLRTETE